jgi:hypothetical protein
MAAPGPSAASVRLAETAWDRVVEQSASEAARREAGVPGRPAAAAPGAGAGGGHAFPLALAAPSQNGTAVPDAVERWNAFSKR